MKRPVSFTKIREELHLEQNRASQQEQRANDLEIIVENIKHKIRQLEDESIANVCQQQNQVKELQKDQQTSQVFPLTVTTSGYCLFVCVWILLVSCWFLT